ncbi:MAG: hypothetical protein PHO76_01305 [Methylotenera sp.]|nr:hypothetical protein [Methylotenera sp.]MDD4925654.1 hypothetical protein [Methylotenera sp.]
MNLRNLSTREQILIFFVAFTVVVGGYGLLRYRPALKALAELQASNIKTADHAKNAVIPEEPVEDIDDLKADVLAADSELAAMALSFTDVEQKLAPEDSQELRLRISDVATNAGVRIRENVPYLMPRVAGGAVAATPVQKLSKRQQRLANKAARKAGATSAAGAIAAAAPTEGSLIYRLTNELETQRPFQRVSVEGSFVQVQSFIQELGKLPFMVTVTQMQIDLSPITPPAGYPQPLVVTMILAL